MSDIHYNACPVCRSVHIHEALHAEDYTVSHSTFSVWQCDACTARFTQDVPDSGSIAAYYHSENYISHSDTQQGLVNKLYHIARQYALQKKYRWIRQYSRLPKGKLLDVGCGTGAFLHAMQQHGWEVTGIEPDAGARSRAKASYGLEIQAPEYLFALPQAHFNAITLWHVLEHVHDLHGYMEQLRKLLHPGGHIYIAVPNYTCLDEKMYGPYWAAYDVPRHLYHFSPDAMKAVLSAHGLQLLDTRAMLLDPFYICLLSEQYKYGKSHFLRGCWNGLRSCLYSVADKNAASSILYIISR